MRCLKTIRVVFSSLFLASLLSTACALAQNADAKSDLGLTAKARINALDYGVKANDENFDNTPLLQKALDDAGKMGGAVVELPSGRFRFDGTLVVPTGVTLQGTYRVPPTVVNKDEKPTGTTLLTYANRDNPDGAPFIDLNGSNSAVVGLVVTYPEWSMSDVPPVPYPPCIASKNTDNVGVIDCCLLNPYEGIKFVLACRHLVRNVTGYPIRRGLFVDECYDIGHIENVHFWPFGVSYKADDPYCEWINVNGVAFEFARTDWHYVSNTFCFGYGRGYYFSDCGHGGTNGNFLGIGADSCRRAVFVEQSQKQGLLVTNGEFVGRWTSEDSVCLEIGEENDGAVMLTNCTFWGPIKTCVLAKHKTGRLTLNACEFVNWDEVHSRNAKAGAPAIDIESGRATIQGCSFEQGGIHLLIGDDAAYVTAVGNQASGGFRVEGNKSPFVTQFAANEVDALECEPGAKTNYVVRFGAPNDSRFIRNWFAPEEDAISTFRWTRDDSKLLLPLAQTSGKIIVEIDIDAPDEAIRDISDEETGEALVPGLYLGDSLLAPFRRGAQRIEVEINLDDLDATDDELPLILHSNSWRPVDTRVGSLDERALGLVARTARVRTPDADETKVFDVAKGKWIDVAREEER